MTKFHRVELACLTLTLAAQAAPLFPSESPAWVRDALQTLSAQGLLEGYPDGAFRGDRASTRWEVALLLARLLARPQGPFASRAERETVLKLAQSFQAELGSLGVAVSGLEEKYAQLDERVTELNRITFSGEFQARVASQHFYNQGSPQSNPTSPLLDYNRMVGALPGAGTNVGTGPAAALEFSPNFFGVFPAVDSRNGALLTSGTGFTSRLLLNMRVELDSDFTAGLGVAAYTSQGNGAVDAFFGVSAPYLSNTFTDSSAPYTRMTLDNFWIHHAPSATTLTVGAFRASNFDPIVYQAQPNPGAYGPRLLDNYGVQLRGDGTEFNYEVMATRIADGNEGLNGLGYFTHAEGVTAGLNFDERRGSVRVNFLRAANENNGVGLIGEINQQNFINWVNPAGYFVKQLPPQGGAGSNHDVRPVPGLGPNDGITGIPNLANQGNLGPQGQTSYGISAGYLLDGFRFFGEWAHSNYKPQKTSAYSADGSAWRAGVEVSLAPVRLEAQYLSVDARYDPFVVQVPRVFGANNLYRTPDFDYYAYIYPLHSTSVYPHNREGFRLKAEWDYSPNGHLEFKYGNLRQKSTSLQDVRFAAGELGPQTPNTPVLGFSPGFVEPIFPALAAQTFAPQVLENPRGRAETLGVALDHHWEKLGLKTFAQRHQFTRPSQLASLAGQDINRVDFTYTAMEVELDYDWSTAVTTRVGYFQAGFRGHYDPFGIYGPYAQARGDTNFANVDFTQHQPFLGVEWKPQRDVTIDAEFRYLGTVDHVGANIYPTPGLPGLNLGFAPQLTAHPFNWGGYRLSTGVTIRF